MPRPKNDRSKIESNVDKSGGLESCWPWNGHSDKDGYPLVTMDYKNCSVHRLMLEWYTNTQGRYALHSCDNPSCCNPNHLRWGDAQDNADDRESRNRGNKGRSKHNDSGRASQSRAISKSFMLTDPDGSIYKGLNLKEFCQKQNLYYVAMTQVCKGSRESYKGWFGIYTES